MIQTNPIESEKWKTVAQPVREAIRLTWNTLRRPLVLWTVMLVIAGVLPAVAVYLTKSVVDGLLDVIQSRSGWSSAWPLITPVLCLASITIAMPLFRAITTWLREFQTERLQEQITCLIHQKSIGVGLAFYDFPEFFDQFHRARDEARYRPAQLLESFGGLLQNSVTMVVVAIMLMTYSVGLTTLLFLSVVPSLAVILRSAVRRRALRARAAPLQRQAWYYDDILTRREAAAEIRVFGLGPHFIHAFQAVAARLRTQRLAALRLDAIEEFAAVSIGMCGLAAVAAWGVAGAMRGTITVGALGMFYAALVQGQSAMRSLLMDAGMVYTNSLFLSDLFAFLGLDSEPAPTETQQGVPKPLRRGIRFESIEFTYPGGSSPALSGFTVDIPAGATVAFVGLNGAGKTTVLKLLSRLYEPQRGRILVDGTDIRHWTPAGFRERVAVLFQDFFRYAATVTDNIGFGAIERRPGAALIEVAARGSGADAVAARLSHGFETHLGKTLECGVELSGGEWQRVAMARALAKTAPILLLDEPTSAMDSWAEADWFDRLTRGASGRTTIIVTHRFTTAMRADVIHVMDAGRIVESGSHAQLLARGGRYAESWSRQTESPLLASTA